MFFAIKKTMNLCRKKIARTFCTVKVFAMAGVIGSWIACSDTGHDSNSGAAKQISIEDSIVIDASSIFKLYPTTIIKKNSTEDSVLLILDKIASVAYKIDIHNNIYDTNAMSKALTADMIDFTINKRKIYFLSEKGVMVFSGEPNVKPKAYGFDLTDVKVNGFHIAAGEFKIMDDGSFLICKFLNGERNTKGGAKVLQQ